MTTIKHAWPALALTTLLWGCGDCGGTTEDAGLTDASVADSGGVDTRNQDGGGLDTQTGLDTAAGDHAAVDSSGQDTATATDAATGDGGGGGLSVYAIQDLTHASHPAADTDVTFGGVVVTAVDNRGNQRGIWVQEPAGGKFSGVYVYKPASSAVDLGTFAIGDVVTVSGTYVEFNGLTEINLGTAGTVTKTGTATALTPTAATDIDTNPEDWEGVLVRLGADCEVEALQQYGEVQTSCGLVDDEFFAYTLAVGEVYSYLDGLWHYSFNAYKLLPRDAADLGPHTTVDGGTTDATAATDAAAADTAVAPDSAVAPDTATGEDAAVVEDAATGEDAASEDAT